VVLGLGGLVPAWDAAVLSSGPYIYGSAYQQAAGETRDVFEVIKACGEVLFHRDGAYATTTIRKAPGGLLSLQVNGKTDASNKADMFTQRLVAHLPLLVHPDPREVLVIGLGSGVTAGAVLDHPVEHVDVLEIAPEVVEASRWFDELTGAPLDDPRTDLHVQDGRAWVQWTDRTYDVLSSEPSNPWVAGMANLFTEEYFRACRRRLRPGGVMVQWVQAYSTSPEDFRSVVATFQKVFPKASLWRSMNQTDFVLLGLTDGPAPDGAEIARRILRDDRRGRSLRDHGLDVRQLALAFVTDEAGVESLAGDAPLVTDDDPFLEFTGPKNLYKDLISQVYATIKEHADPTGLARILTDADVLIAARGEVETAIELRDQALALALHGDAGEAARLLEEVLRRLPDDELTRNSYSSLMKERARSLRKSGDPTTALATLDRLLEQVDDDVEARHLRGLARTEVGDLPAAREDLEEVLAEHPADRTAFRNLSVILYKQGELGASLGAFLRSLQGVEPSAKEWRNLAELYRGTGEFPRAALCWKRSLDLEPDQPEIQELYDMYVEVAGEDGVAKDLGTEE
jgi:spermidine synthase